MKAHHDSRIQTDHVVVGKTLLESRQFNLFCLYPVVKTGTEIITGVICCDEQIRDLGYYFDDVREAWINLDSCLDNGQPVSGEDGATVYLTQPAYQAPRDNGEVYLANGVDNRGRRYLITWEISACDDDDEACDWDNPVSVDLID